MKYLRMNRGDFEALDIAFNAEHFILAKQIFEIRLLFN